MAKSRAQKAALNTMTAAAAEVVALICGLILPRLILANFGSAYNGITSSARQYLNALSILNVGIAGSTRVALYKSLSRGDIAASSAIVRATEKHMRRVGLILAAYVLVLMVVYPLLVDTGYTWIEVAPLILAAGVGSFGTYFFGTTYQAFLSADQCVYISNLFLIAATIANTAISAALILMGCTVQVVMLVSSAVLFMKPFLQSLYVRKKYKLDRHCQPDELALSRRRDVMAHSIANIVHDNTDIVVLTIFCDVKVVSVYTVYNLVMHALKKIQGVFTTGTEAVFGSMWARGETDKIRTTLGYFEYAVGSFITVVFSTTLVMILPFIAHYTHRVTDVEYVLPAYAAVITIAQMCYCLRAPYLTLVQGAGRYRETKKGAYLEAIINLTVSVVLVQFIGIVGVAVGTLLANII
ncbi:MAG: sugar isomerase, partial [Firmicutes bacterium]|nr:sugar isomerase [Bacillota bacterium]